MYSAGLSVSPLAFAALLLFVPFALAMFAVLRPPVATAVVFLTGVLLLPERIGFDAPGLPLIDKYVLTSLCATFGLAIAGQFSQVVRCVRGVPLLITVLLMAGTVGTWFTNRDAMTYGPLQIPGITLKECVRMLFSLAPERLLPFFIGAAIFRRLNDMATLLKFIIVATIGYSLFILIEVRFSPQLHNWIYGYHQHQFVQSLRGGGYRPMVFLRHGIAVATFVMTAFIAALALGRARIPVGSWSPKPISFFLAAMLVLCKSAAAFLYGATSTLMILFTKGRTQTRLAMGLALIALGYPLLQFTNTFPSTQLVDFSARMSQERAASLQFRFRNEALLLDKAAQRPVFGWGIFGRNRVYDAYTGKDIAVTDGQWIILLGVSGIIGFAGIFGLMVWPIFSAAALVKKVREGPVVILMSGMALIVAFHLVDLLPNSMFYHLSLMFAGSLWGTCQELKMEAKNAQQFA